VRIQNTMSPPAESGTPAMEVESERHAETKARTGGEEKNPDTQEATCAENEDQQPSKDTIYDFYAKELLPSLLSSLPILMGRLFHDFRDLVVSSLQGFVTMVIPWRGGGAEGPNLPELWQHNSHAAAASANPKDFLLRYFDANGDGDISQNELLNMTEVIRAQFPTESWMGWLSHEWFLMDWKIGAYMWHSFGGILLLVMVLVSFVPGRMHGLSAKILRWPILAITNFLILVELL
jgi:hypothetical protein